MAKYKYQKKNIHDKIKFYKILNWIIRSLINNNNKKILIMFRVR